MSSLWVFNIRRAAGQLPDLSHLQLFRSMISLKTILYRGGIARFQIPASWVEEYEPRGGGTFYEPGDDTGTLRINVLDFDHGQGWGKCDATAFEILTRTRSPAQTETLPSGAAVARYVTYAEENGERLRFPTWQICVRISAMRFRMVVFTYTIVDGQEQEPAMQAELKLLDQLIVNGEYPAVEGVPGTR